MGLFGKKDGFQFDREALVSELNGAIGHLTKAKEILSLEAGATEELIAIRREAADEATACLRDMKKSVAVLDEIIPPRQKSAAKALYRSLEELIARLSRACLDCNGFPSAVKKSVRPLSDELAALLDEATRI